MAKFFSFKFLRDLIFARFNFRANRACAIQNAHVMKLHVKFSRFFTFAKMKSQQTFPVIRYVGAIEFRFWSVLHLFRSCIIIVICFHSLCLKDSDFDTAELKDIDYTPYLKFRQR